MRLPCWTYLAAWGHELGAEPGDRPPEDLHLREERPPPPDGMGVIINLIGSWKHGPSGVLLNRALRLRQCVRHAGRERGEQESSVSVRGDKEKPDTREAKRFRLKRAFSLDSRHASAVHGGENGLEPRGTRNREICPSSHGNREICPSPVETARYGTRNREKMGQSPVEQGTARLVHHRCE